MTDEIQAIEEQEPEALTPAAPITGRFLFVDVAARRAKQLRRGARPRLDQDSESAPLPIKPERIAMEEVRQGLVHYELPPVAGRTEAPAVS
jgi:DNA-directed RNA polymerase omega subunit